ncbi:MAG: Bor family protein [Bacteroidetes bacterium]|nr:Bor family protein [Rhodothermia bacterium]MCS7155345.1 Bor family protein [Bacteroidota bacterium]MCX7907562.1 Bor family protein [Bacteroidota bacterium]MDW8138556.1 hypothetical protein [Bacteroidota bacterium]MDW8284507.1 hypothetical protein [Bacteroidota bacterium]
MHRASSLMLVLLVFLTASGCYTMQYVIPPERDPAEYEIVRSFQYQRKAHFLVFGLVPIGPPQAETIIRDEVRRYNGVAATNIMIMSQLSVVDWLISAITGGLYFPWTYEVRGDVVRFRAAAPQRRDDDAASAGPELIGPVRYTVPKR